MSRPKPWEVSSGTSGAAASGEAQIMDSILNNNDNTSIVPPPKPESLSLDNNAGSADIGNSLGTGYSGYGSGMGGRYGSSMYGSSMYGGLGGYGGYGGLGGLGSLGGYGGYGNYGMMGMNNGPMQNSGIASSTQATFQLIESLIGAVGGFAQMLEATYMATQSSFFTMVSVGEQFGNLKNALGSVFGIFALVKYLKKLLLKITGLRVFKEKIKFNTDEFQEFSANGGAVNKSKTPKISLKPLLIFLAAVFGVPYLLNKLVKALAQQQQHQQQQQLNGHFPRMQPQQQQISGQANIDPKTIEFCRALYDFNPEDPQVELELKQGSLYAILSKKDGFGKDSQWWKCRSRDGKIGYVPSNYLEVIKRSNLENKLEKSVKNAHKTKN